jgi:dihydroorotate dehydrogenase electron transfer subunit
MSALRQHLAVIEGAAEPMPGFRLLLLDCPALAESARPGQFIMVRASEGYDPYLRLPLPIHRFREGGVAILFRPSQPGYAWLGDRHPGDTLDLLGPGGVGFALPTTSANVAVICQGTGLAPVIGILDRVLGPAQLVLGVATSAQAYPRELLPAEIEYTPHVGIAVGDAFWQAVTGACRWANHVYAAGPTAFYRQLLRVWESTHLRPPPDALQVWVDADMACGMGICNSCLLNTRRGPRHACTDGPVHNLSDLVLD